MLVLVLVCWCIGGGAAGGGAGGGGVGGDVGAGAGGGWCRGWCWCWYTCACCVSVGEGYVLGVGSCTSVLVSKPLNVVDTHVAGF